MKKSALGTVFLVVLIDLIGFGIVLPLLPFYAKTFQASPISIGLLFTVYSFAQILLSPIWGGLSDRIGRRPIMLLSTFGSVCAYLLFAFSQSFAMLLFSRLFAGIMAANISSSQAYVADVTSHKDRAKGMGILGAAFGLGFVLGPAIAALLIHPAVAMGLERLGLNFLSEWSEINRYALPGLFASLLSLTSFILVIFKLPEPVRNNRVDKERVSRPNIFSRQFWIFLLSKTPGIRKHALAILLGCMFLLTFGQSTLYSAFPLFCENILKLSPGKVGLLYAYMGIIAAVIQGGLIRQLLKRYSEKALFFAGSILLVVGIGCIPLANSEGSLLFFLSIMTVGASLDIPTLQSMISKQADPNRIGATMGVSQGFSSLGRVVGPTWGGILYSVSIAAPFLATAIVLLLLVGAGYHLRRTRHSYQDQQRSSAHS